MDLLLKTSMFSYAKVYYSEVLGLKVRIVFIDYEYRNIKDGVNRVITEVMSVKGDNKAMSNPIRKQQKEDLIKILPPKT